MSSARGNSCIHRTELTQEVSVHLSNVLISVYSTQQNSELQLTCCVHCIHRSALVQPPVSPHRCQLLWQVGKSCIHQQQRKLCLLRYTDNTKQLTLSISLSSLLTLSPPIPLRVYTLPYWSNRPV